MHFCYPWQLGRKHIASTADDRFSFRFWVWQSENLNGIFMLTGKLCFTRHTVFPVQNIKINKAFIHLLHCMLAASPFKKEQLICRSRGGLLRWESSTVSVLRIQESERQRGVCTSSWSRGDSILQEEHLAPWGYGWWCCPSCPARLPAAFEQQRPVYPCFCASPILRNTVKLLRTYSSVKVRLCSFLDNTWHLFRKSVARREKMEICFFHECFIWTRWLNTANPALCVRRRL